MVNLESYYCYRNTNFITKFLSEIRLTFNLKEKVNATVVARNRTQTSC